jgi:hypothetical protein
MSKEIREFIEKVKNNLLTENKLDKSISEYLNQVEYGDYEELTEDLYDFISMEGWLVNIEDEFDDEYNQEDFEYMTLDLSDIDKAGLINDNKDVIEKFNKFDIELKKRGEFPYDTLDFIDYENGIVYIIRLI